MRDRVCGLRDRLKNELGYGTSCYAAPCVFNVLCRANCVRRAMPPARPSENAYISSYRRIKKNPGFLRASANPARYYAPRVVDTMVWPNPVRRVKRRGLGVGHAVSNFGELTMKQVFLPVGVRGLVATPGGFLLAAATSTYAYGISGSNIVGIYDIAGGGGGAFRYDGNSYHTFNFPSARSTSASGIDGSNIVGFYIEPTEDQTGVTHGFLYNYNGSSFTTVDNPLVPAGQLTGTFPAGIEGRNIVGYCRDLNLTPFAFLYDGSSFEKLHPPSATGGTFASGISGGKIVGNYFDAKGLHGYLYDGNSYQTLDHPSASETLASGISGRNIAGSFRDANGYHGFLYDGSSFKTLDHPAATGGTFPLGIDGSRVVGYFIDGGYHGFVYDGSSFQTLDYSATGRRVHGHVRVEC
jgi:hypothetical protein